AGLTVLLAEDNATNQIVASQMLGALGARVVLASDGVEALELFERHEVDILLVDIEMPRMSGIEVIRAVRARPDARARTTVIALTAYAMREHRARIREAGADGIIAKPIMGIEELGRAISTLHAQRRGRDDSGAAARDGGVDPVVFGELCATIGPAAMIEFLEKVEGDLAEVGEGLRAGLEAGDLKLIGARSHVLISVAGAIGAREMQHLAEELNRQVHARARAELPGLVGRIHAGIGKPCAFVRREREALERDG
ncbi:MAG: response regulator, partial [Alphaproteobacteria bacterium]